MNEILKALPQGWRLEEEENPNRDRKRFGIRYRIVNPSGKAVGFTNDGSGQLDPGLITMRR